ncbi:hypothetical protein HYFRA_00006125 [Hymenoscyphus fraxineus]|uniref:glutathione transferase n=1 Tax=Hymenoscyphus fraxineus TaxID=746836 RepID=A0A9N9LAN4_9HELO|nr:hypothetical protein HYFRA_00006125 [Hymenoscyphus fraxineus]
MTKPIKVWMAPAGPNPWKVVLILEELSIPYEIVAFKFDDVKRKPFITLNPNGRAPAIEDPNIGPDGLVLWESGAIIQYLVEQYDTEKKLTYETFEKYKVNQWLMFQMSGQGPYYGQLGWFNVLHQEKLPSAILRYKNEVRRVLGVLETSLEGKTWLVGNKCTYADLSFVTWNERLDALFTVPAERKFEGFPNVEAWHGRMVGRPSWKAAMEKRKVIMDEQGLMWNGMPKGISTYEQYVEKIESDRVEAEGK